MWVLHIRAAQSAILDCRPYSTRLWDTVLPVQCHKVGLAVLSLCKHRHIEFFQSLERFWEWGLPRELLATELERDLHLCEVQNEASNLAKEGSSRSAIKKARKAVYNYRASLHDQALREYQHEWVRKSRHQKIWDRGKQQAKDSRTTDLFRSMCLLIPERGRLVEMIVSDKLLSQSETFQAIRDLPLRILPSCTFPRGRCMSSLYLSAEANKIGPRRIESKG